jgi:hypothetical protein
MITRFQRSIALVAAATSLAGVFGAGAQSERIELAEAKAALASAMAQNRALRSDNDRLKIVNRNLGESLRSANIEAEDFRKRCGDMRLQMEALGIDAVTNGVKGVEDQLTKALRDVSLLEGQNRRLKEALIALSDAVLSFAGTAVVANDKARADIERAIAAADEVLRKGGLLEEAPLETGTLHHAKVVSVKKEFGVVILNVGRESGLRVGTQFEIYRVDRPIGTVIVTDTREHISAALVQNLNVANDPPRVTDTARVATTE